MGYGKLQLQVQHIKGLHANQGVKWELPHNQYTEEDMQSYNHFTLEERENLRIKLLDGKSLRQIARELDRNASSISRELKRNGKIDGSYNAWWGCSLYICRRKQCRRHKRYTMDAELLSFTQKCLAKYWSPEIITVKWKIRYPGTKLSHCTIYRALKAGELPGYPADRFLRRRNRLKYKRGNNQTIRPLHVIGDRPKEVNHRERIGDWEGDLVHGALGKGYLVTCIDRKSRYLVSTMVQNMQAKTVSEAICAVLEGIPVKTLTLDRGPEFANFRELERDLNATIYFADPHSPWQRGSNENVNGLIRFFFPKGTDYTKILRHELEYVLELINTRPRKCLGWLSPREIFTARCCT